MEMYYFDNKILQLRYENIIIITVNVAKVCSSYSMAKIFKWGYKHAHPLSIMFREKNTADLQSKSV